MALRQLSPDAGAIRLCDLETAAGALAVECPSCNRHGRYRLKTPIKTYGPRAGLPHLRRVLVSGGECRGSVDPQRPCHARFPRTDKCSGQRLGALAKSPLPCQTEEGRLTARLRSGQRTRPDRICSRTFAMNPLFLAKQRPGNLALAHLVALALVAFGGIARADTAELNSAAVHAAVWEVHNSAWGGTAWALDECRFLTNAHVINRLFKKGGRIVLTQKDNPTELTFYRLVALSMTYDLALFNTRETVKHHLPVARHFSKELAVGLHTVGYLGGQFTTARQGGPIVYEDELSYALPLNVTHRQGGFSGSPILNANDEVVMVRHSAARDANLVYGAKLDVLHRFLKGDVGIICPWQGPSRRCLEDAIERTRRMGAFGHEVAQYQLGKNDLIPARAVVARTVASNWMRKAAEAGFPGAQRSLGIKFYEEENWREAFFWLDRAARSGDPVSQYNLGFIYEQGKGVQRDMEASFSWMNKAALAGYDRAQFVVGNMYYHGRGVAPDRASARFWFEKAAANGNAEAKKSLEEHF